MTTIKTYLQLLAYLTMMALAAIILIGLPLVGVYFWWYGILAAVNSWGFGWIWSFILVASALIFIPWSKIIAAGIGLYGGIYVLGWHWFFVTGLYLTSLWLLSVGGIIAFLLFIIVKTYVFFDEGVRQLFSQRN